MSGAGGGIFRCTDGGLLHYSSAGSGEPVVLIHGLSLDASMWDPQWAALQSEFRAIRYDLRGFGGSSVPQGPYSHSDDLSGLLDFLGARPAHVVSLSMGGRVAMRLALEQPDAVRSLTLIDSALEGFTWSDAWTRGMNAILAAARAGDVEAAKRLWLDSEIFAPAKRVPGLAAELASMVARYSAWHWRNTDPQRKADAPAIRQLAGVSAPTLVLVGELDVPDFQDIARCLGAKIPRAVLRTIAGAGHMANMEAAESVNELLLAHLRCRAPAMQRANA